MARNDFDAIRQQFPNDEAILNRLRVYSAFNTIGRATLSRWAQAPPDELPRRCRLAVSILEQIRGLEQPTKPEKVCKIPIFHHATELALPAVVAYSGLFPDSCAARLHVRVKVEHGTQTKDGSQALDQLAKSQHGFAFADRSVANEIHQKNSCLPVCVIATSFPLVISTMRLKSMSNLSHAQFYCPKGSSLAKNIRQALRRRGIRVSKTMVTELLAAPSLPLEPTVNHCFVGWSSWIEDIRTKVPGMVEGKATTIGLSPVYYTLFAKPGALTFSMVGLFLLSLQQVFENVEGLRQHNVREFRKNQLGEVIAKLPKIVEDRKVIFKLGKLNTATVLEFLKRELSGAGGPT